jgi:hypothetical protein
MISPVGVRFAVAVFVSGAAFNLYAATAQQYVLMNIHMRIATHVDQWHSHDLVSGQRDHRPILRSD